MTAGDLVQLFLQLGGEANIDDIGEVLAEQAGDDDAEFGGR